MQVPPAATAEGGRRLRARVAASTVLTWVSGRPGTTRIGQQSNGVSGRSSSVLTARPIAINGPSSSAAVHVLVARPDGTGIRLGRSLASFAYSGPGVQTVGSARCGCAEAAIGPAGQGPGLAAATPARASADLRRVPAQHAATGGDLGGQVGALARLLAGGRPGAGG